MDCFVAATYGFVDHKIKFLEHVSADLHIMGSLTASASGLDVGHCVYV